MNWPDPIYVIYMPQREEYIKDVFKTLKLAPIYVPAVPAKELPSLKELLQNNILGDIYLRKYLENENYPNMDLNSFEADPKNTAYINSKLKGVLALQLSYMRVFEIFLQKAQPGDHCFIFEDDIIPAKWQKRMQQIFKELPHDYDIINLGRCFDKCKKNIKYSENLVINTLPLCTHACGYSVAIARYIVSHALPMQEACDTLLRKLYNSPDFHGFSAKPALFFQNKKLAGLLGNTNYMPECGDDKKLIAKKIQKKIAKKILE